jgi:DmsE family decaheme c-type cytochrome
MQLPAGSVAVVIALLAGAMAPAVAAEESAGASAAYSAKGADSCLGCHDDAALLGLFRTKHARPKDDRGPFGHGGLQCEACHGPGGAHVLAHGKQPAGIVDFGPHARSPVARQNAQCLSCHQANAAHEWASSAHAAGNVPCAACHTLHAAQDPVRSAATQSEVCTGCHEAQHTDLFKPSHHPLREGKMACTSCHAPHGSTAPAQLVNNTVTETCTSCHAEYRGPFLWEHQPVAEDCSNCHDAHGSAQATLLKARPPFLCQQCHEGAGHPSIVNGPQGLAGGTPSAYLLAGGCTNCHSQVHGSNHPSGRALMR